jgi:hypothetical protein
VAAEGRAQAATAEAVADELRASASTSRSTPPPARRWCSPSAACRRADRPLLQPLRRPAGRPARAVDRRPLHARRARRQAVRPRRHRRQGPARLARRRARVAEAPPRRRAADRRRLRGRGRGGGRQPEHGALRGRHARAPAGRRLRVGVRRRRRPRPPHLVCGLKGIVTVDLSVRTAAYDQHSGLGPVVQNAVWLMAAAVASLRDADGRVLIDGFYDRVRPATEREAHYVAAAPREDDVIARQIGVERFLGGATGTEWQRRAAARAGRQRQRPARRLRRPGHEDGPARLRHGQARLPPGARPGPLEIVGLLRAHLDRHGFGAVEATLAERPEHPSRVDPDHPWVRHAAAALEEVYGTPASSRSARAARAPWRPSSTSSACRWSCSASATPRAAPTRPTRTSAGSTSSAARYATVRTIERWAGLTPAG